MKSNGPLRAVAFLLAAIILLQQPLWAVGEIIPASPAVNLPQPMRDTFFDALPAKWGMVQTVYKGKAPFFLIHIQDAHLNTEAQRNIARITDFFALKTGLKHIYLEGASGELSHRALSLYPDARARQLTADSFLRAGILSGPEYAAIAKHDDFVLYGVEEKGLYEKNRTAFLKALEIKAGEEEPLRRIQKRTRELSSHVFSPRLRRFFKEKEKFRQETGMLPEYAAFLAETAAILKIGGRYPQMEHLEKIRTLKKKDLKAQWKELSRGLTLALFDEIQTLEEKIPEAAARTEDERELAHLFSRLEILDKLFDFSLTHEDAGYFYAHRQEFDFEKIMAGILKLSKKYGFVAEIEAAGVSLNEALSQVEKFYQTALERDRVLAGNAISDMQKQGVKTAVLVTGGFHTPALEKILREKEISYAVIAPRMTRAPDKLEEVRYAEAMRVETGSFSRLMQQARQYQRAYAADLRFQLQTPRQLPTAALLSDFAASAQTSAPLPVLAGTFPEMDFIFQAMILMSASGIALNHPKPAFEEMRRALTPAEWSAASRIYPWIHSDETLIRRDFKRGAFVTDFSKDQGFAIHSDWQLKSEKPEWNQSRSEEMRYTTADGLDYSVRLIADPALRDLARSRLASRRAPLLWRSENRFKSNGQTENGQPDALKQLLDQWNLQHQESAPVQADQKPETPAAVPEESAGLLWGGHDELHVLLDYYELMRRKLEKRSEVRNAALLLDAPVLALSLIGFGFSLQAAAAGLGILLAIRAGLAFARLIHEWFHLTAARLFSGEDAVTKANLLGNRDGKTWLRSLLPFQPVVLYAFVSLTTESSWVRKAGFFGSFFYTFTLLTLALFSAPSQPSFLLASALAGAAFVLMQSALSDLWTAQKPGIYCCGNQGILAAKSSGEKGITPKWIDKLMEGMGQITKVRGEQAAGRVVMTNRGFIRYRIVNPKRDDLARQMRRQGDRAVFQGRLRGRRASSASTLVMEHYRYGTSSAPDEEETHPHQWVPERTVKVWTAADGKLALVSKRLANAISHNGDFDYWNIFKRDMPNEVIGLWLENVLNISNHTTGDSPKIAGMMDLLITQGMWDTSVRMAYQLEVAESEADAFNGIDPETVWNRIVASHHPETPTIVLKRAFRREMSINTAPEKELIKLWADLFETAFQKYTGRILNRGATKLNDYDSQVFEELKQEMMQKMETNTSTRSWGSEKLQRFVDRTLQGFFENDINHTTRLFLSRAKGSFGLAVVSSLEPDTIVLAAQGQPMSIGFYPQKEFIAYASEAAALKVPINEKGDRIPYRIDLDQIGGEVAEVKLEGLRVYSLEMKREITKEEWEHSGRIIDMLGNPLVDSLPPKGSLDPVGDDIRDIPKVLAQIREDWANPDSFNHQTAVEFLDQVAQKAVHPEERSGAGEYDILISGIEVSQWTGEHFAQTLQRTFPQLKVGILSSNKLLESAIDGTPTGIGPKTIVFLVTQSGQTFPSLNAGVGLQGTSGKKGPGRIFVMTGEMDTLVGASIGQRYYKGAPFSKRIFINGSRRRSAEPSSVAVAAAHQTLTELLLFLIRELPKKSKIEKPLGLTLDEKETGVLNRLRDSVIDRGIVSIVGYTSRGDKVSTKENQALSRQGKIWAGHVLEPAVTWGLAALYVLATVIFAMPLFSSLHVYGLKPFLPAEFEAASMYFFRTLDAILYIFLGFFLTLGLRKNIFSPRELFARLGKRTLVIGDIPFIHQALESFVSKLFSMSYGHASIDVHGANPRDHMLHRFGHRVTRGTLIFLGVPDGRLPVLKRAESNVLMTAKQAKGVRNLGVGAEVVTVSHNPVTNANATNRPLTLWTHSVKPLESPALQNFYEERFAALERLVAAFVFFHSMAKKVSNFRPLRYDMSRSQSGTRIATTAAPVSGADLAKVFLNGRKAPERLPVVTEKPVKLPFRAVAEPAALPQKKIAGTSTVQTAQANNPEALFAQIRDLIVSRVAERYDALISKVRNHTWGEGLSVKEAVRQIMQFRKEEEQILSGRKFHRLPEIKQALDAMTAEKMTEIRSLLTPATRSEAREAGPAMPVEELTAALKAKTSLERRLQLDREIPFEALEEEAQRQGWDLLHALQNFTSLETDYSKLVQPSGSGEVLFVYRPEDYGPDFIKEFFRRVRSDRRIRQVTFLKDISVNEKAWKELQGQTARFMLLPGQKIIFAEGEGSAVIHGLLMTRTRALGLSLSQVIQFPQIKTARGQKYTQALMLGALPIANSTLLILGHHETLEQVRVIQTHEIVEAVLNLQARKAIETAA